jgi:hypothetical protein
MASAPGCPNRKHRFNRGKPAAFSAGAKLRRAGPAVGWNMNGIRFLFIESSPIVRCSHCPSCGGQAWCSEGSKADGQVFSSEARHTLARAHDRFDAVETSRGFRLSPFAAISPFGRSCDRPGCTAGGPPSDVPLLRQSLGRTLRLNSGRT